MRLCSGRAQDVTSEQSRVSTRRQRACGACGDVAQAACSKTVWWCSSVEVAVQPAVQQRSPSAAHRWWPCLQKHRGAVDGASLQFELTSIHNTKRRERYEAGALRGILGCKANRNRCGTGVRGRLWHLGSGFSENSRRTEARGGFYPAPLPEKAGTWRISDHDPSRVPFRTPSQPLRLHCCSLIPLITESNMSIVSACW